MSEEIETKTDSFGGVTIDHFSPTPPAESHVLNVRISFEEALKLQIALQHVLLHLNGYERRFVRGRDACVNLRIHTDKNRLVISEASLRKTE